MKNKNSYEVLEAEVAKLKEENRHLKDERDELKYMLNDMHSVVDAANDDFFNEMSRLCGCIEIEGTRITAAYQDLVGILLANGYTVEVEQTINQCDDLIMFQKIVKLSNNYNWVEHEHGTGQIIKTTKHRDGTQKYTYKSYRVFASNRVTDGRLLRRKVVKPKGEKFGNTPDHSFIYNDSVIGVKVPPELDKQWYIDLARKRLKQFGIAA